MTENEAIKIINDKYETFFALSTTNDFDMAMATSIKALEEIQQYRAIGTVEELKAYKQGNCTNDCEHYDSTAEYVRNNAIDEFAEQLKEQVSSHFRYKGIIEESTEYADYIDEVAEQMKAGGKNES